MLSLTTDAATLLPKMAQAARFAARPNSGVPIRDCIMLTATSSGIVLHASDAALGFTSSEIPAVVKATGSLCLPASTLLAAVKAVGTGALTLQEGEANRAIIRAPGVSYTLIGMPAADYPVRSKVETTDAITFAALDLSTALGVVIPNIPGDDNRYGLNGVALELYEGRTRFVATDGNRLSWAEAASSGTMTLKKNTMIGRVGVTALAGLLDGLAGTTVTFAPGGRYIEITTDAGTMHAQLIDADFPDYRQVIPSKFVAFATGLRADILRAVDRVIPFAGGTIPEVLVTLEAGADVGLSSRKLDFGESAVTLAAEVSGESMKLGLNAKYLRDALLTMDSDTVTMAFSGSMSPAFVSPAGTPANSSAARMNVIMPVRIV